jgi:hypothetical protein
MTDLRTVEPHDELYEVGIPASPQTFTLRHKKEKFILHYSNINEGTPIDRITTATRFGTREKQQAGPLQLHS